MFEAAGVKMTKLNPSRENVVIDFDYVDIDIEAVKGALYDVRSNIQYMLPEIEEE